MYTDNVELSPDHVMALIYAAKKYMLPALVDRCKTFLLNCISAENVCVIIEQSATFGESDLAETCREFLILHLESIFSTEGFKRLSYSSLRDIVGDERLKISELLLYKACVQWATVQCELRNLDTSPPNLRSVLEDIIYLIRFPTMQVTVFARDVSTAAILTAEEMVAVFQYLTCGIMQPTLKFPTNVRKGNLLMCALTERENNGVCICNVTRLQVDKSIRIHSVIHTIGRDVKNKVISVEQEDNFTSASPESENEAYLSKPLDVKANKVFTLRYQNQPAQPKSNLNFSKPNVWTKELLVGNSVAGVRFRNASGPGAATVFTAIRFQLIE